MASGVAEPLQRLTIHLPIGPDDQSKDALAYTIALDWLKQRKRVTGLTESEPMWGFWKDESSGVWINERVKMVIVDFSLAKGSDGKSLDIQTYVARLEAIIDRMYRRWGTEQALFWFIVSPVIRITHKLNSIKGA